MTEYLLAVGHPVGGSKARYFESRGYSVAGAEVLEQALRQVAADGEVTKVEATAWGTKYVVVGDVTAPDGNPMTLGTVWIVVEARSPLFVTAYPMLGTP